MTKRSSPKSRAHDFCTGSFANSLEGRYWWWRALLDQFSHVAFQDGTELLDFPISKEFSSRMSFQEYFIAYAIPEH